MIEWHQGAHFSVGNEKLIGSRVSISSLLSYGTKLVPKEPKQLPIRGGVSTFFRCEAPFWRCQEIECRIMPSPPARKPWTPPRRQASLQAAPPHHCSGLYGHATWRQPVWPVASSETP